MIHAEGPGYDYSKFRPWRLQALAFKAIRNIYPDYDLWRGTEFKYEYTDDVLAIDVINGGPTLREWVDDAASGIEELEAIAALDEADWTASIQEVLIY